MTSNSNNNLDDLLNNLKSQYKKVPELKNYPKISQKDDKLDDLLDSVKSQLQNHQTETNNYKYKSQKKSQVNQSLDSLKTQYKTQKSQQKVRKQATFSQNKQEIILQEQQKQLQRKQLTRQAEKWLSNLDPVSEEGMWFNQLAESYTSRLEAAISYLSSLDNPNF